MHRAVRASAYGLASYLLLHVLSPSSSSSLVFRASWFVRRAYVLSIGDATASSLEGVQGKPLCGIGLSRDCCRTPSCLSCSSHPLLSLLERVGLPSMTVQVRTLALVVNQSMRRVELPSDNQFHLPHLCYHCRFLFTGDSCKPGWQQSRRQAFFGMHSPTAISVFESEGEGINLSTADKKMRSKGFREASSEGR